MKFLMPNITAVLAAILSTTVLHANLAKGKALYASCVACHQANGQGNKALKAPAIAGQEEWYLKTQLKNFKEGIRGANPKDAEGMMMAPMSKALRSDEDIAAVSAYVASLKSDGIEHEINDGESAKGKSLYASCAACHGANAEGNKALKAPSLKAINDWYSVSQLKKFKAGIRGAHPKDTAGATMRPMAMMLADEQAMKDVIAYIKTLK